MFGELQGTLVAWAFGWALVFEEALVEELRGSLPLLLVVQAHFVGSLVCVRSHRRAGLFVVWQEGSRGRVVCVVGGC